jgi:hypothetical protein
MPKSSRYQPEILSPQPPAAGWTIEKLIAFQKSLRATVPQSRHFALDPGIKATFETWTAATDQLDAADVKLVQVLAQVEPTRRLVAGARARYWLATTAFLAAARVALAGDRSGYMSLGLHVQEQPRRPQRRSQSELRVYPRKGRPGCYVARWTPVKGATRYEVERSGDPSSAPFVRVFLGSYTRHRGRAEVGKVIWLRMRAAGAAEWTTVRYEVV